MGAAPGVVVARRPGSSAARSAPGREASAVEALHHPLGPLRVSLDDQPLLNLSEEGATHLGIISFDVDSA
jgi:hypothetical protein